MKKWIGIILYIIVMTAISDYVSTSWLYVYGFGAGIFSTFFSKSIK